MFKLDNMNISHRSMFTNDKEKIRRSNFRYFDRITILYDYTLLSYDTLSDLLNVSGNEKFFLEIKKASVFLFIVRMDFHQVTVSHYSTS